MSSLILLKCASALLLLFVACAGGLIPLRMKMKKVTVQVTTACNAFAGGVLFAAALVHMLPASSEGLQDMGRCLQHELNPNGEVKAFPLAETIAGSTFMLFYFCEVGLSRKKIHARPHAHGHDESGRFNPAPLMATEPTGDTGGNGEGLCCASESLHGVCSDSSHAFTAITSKGCLAVGPFFLALTVHSLLEGVGIGLQANAAQFAAVFVAVLAHKGLAGFALGSQLVRYCACGDVLFGVGAFSLCSPIGIVIGALVSSGAGNDRKAMVQAVASGTFMYVAIPELLIPSFKASSRQEVNLVMGLVGFLGMALLAAWA